MSRWRAGIGQYGGNELVVYTRGASLNPEDGHSILSGRRTADGVIRNSRFVLIRHTKLSAARKLDLKATANTTVYSQVLVRRTREVCSRNWRALHYC